MSTTLTSSRSKVAGSPNRSIFRAQIGEKRTSKLTGQTNSSPVILTKPSNSQRHCWHPNPSVRDGKGKTIYNAFNARELAPTGISGFLNFAFDWENAGRMSVLLATSPASACLGFKSIFVDTQALDFCFEGRIGNAELSCCARWSRYPPTTLHECSFDCFLFVSQ
jgi:hypothetical protein